MNNIKKNQYYKKNAPTVNSESIFIYIYPARAAEYNVKLIAYI